ncbi:MAG: hypothetical protein ACK5JH_09330 [Anaerocolumna sp.]
MSISQSPDQYGNVTYQYEGKTVGYADILYSKADTTKLAQAFVVVDEGITMKEHLKRNPVA